MTPELANSQNEITDSQKVQIKKIIALRVEGKMLNIALKEVGMSYDTYRDVMASIPNPTYDFVQKFLQRFVTKYMENFIYNNTELNEDRYQKIKTFFDNEVTSAEMGFEELLAFKDSFCLLLSGLERNLNSVVHEIEVSTRERIDLIDQMDYVNRTAPREGYLEKDDIPF